MDKITRPAPPSEMLADDLFDMVLVPAPDVSAWAQDTILAEGGQIHNPGHAHLVNADIGFLWASSAFVKRGRTVVGQAEQVMIRAGGWQKARQEQQLREWFGNVPEFLITLAADYCAQCSDTEFCALIEHELYHVGQEQDEFGAPKFTKDGVPKLTLRGHDVEEFVGVVERYGASDQVARMLEAAKRSPSVSGVSIAHACGTCLLRAA